MTALARVFSMAGLNGTAAAFNAGSAVVATIALGPADRGLMVVGLTAASFMALVSGLGSGPVFRSRYPTSTVEDRSSLVSTYTWWSAGGMVVAPVLAVAAVSASAPFIDPRLAAPALLFGVALYTSSQALMVQQLEAWYADGHFNQAVSSSAVISALNFSFVIACLYLARTPAAFLMAQGLGTLIACLVVAARLRTVGLLRFGRITPRELGRLLSGGTTALGVNAGLALVVRADRYVLGIMAGPVAVGVYSLAATMSEFARLLPTATGQLMLHETALGRGAEGSRRLLRIGVVTTAAGSILVGVAGWVFIVPVFGAEFSGARGPLLILLVAEIAFAPYAVGSRGLLGGGWTWAAGTLGMVGAAAAIPAYAVAASLAGASGTAVASLVVYAALSAASWILLRRRLQSGPRSRSHSGGRHRAGRTTDICDVRIPRVVEGTEL